MLHRTLNTKNYFETAAILSIVLLVFAHQYEYWPLVALAAAILIIGLLVPVLFYPLAFLWFGLAEILSVITTKILLALVYFLMITPMGIVRRYAGKDSLSLKHFKKKSNGLLKTKNHTYQPKDLKNTF